MKPKHWKTTLTIEKTCKHHGLTNFYNYENPVCVECVSEKRKRYVKKNKKKVDEYNRQYVLKNHSTILKKEKERSLKLKKDHIEKNLILLSKIENQIDKIFKSFKINIDLKYIAKKMPPDLNEKDATLFVYNMCKQKFITSFKAKVAWTESHKIKHEMGINKTTWRSDIGKTTTISTYNNAPESLKILVRKKTMKRVYDQTNNALKAIEKNF